MSGTIVCGVTNTEGARRALDLAVELSERLECRLVLAHVAEGVGAINGEESLSAQYGREGAERLLVRLSMEFGLDESDHRWAVGDRVRLLALIAAEEAADLIVLGSRPGGLFRRGHRSTLADELAEETSIPVVVVPSERSRSVAHGELTSVVARR